MLTQKQTHLQTALDALADAPGMVGAVLVSRDGFCMMNRFKALPGAETFSAMSATLMGAAEAALNEIGTERPLRIIVETSRHRMVTAGATGELLVVAMSEIATPLADVLMLVESAAAQIATVMSGQ